MAAMFSMEITGRMYFSLPPPRKVIMVSGTKIISETSLVTNMEVKNTPKIKNSESAVMRLSPEAKRTMGISTFSCLKPSSTQSIISRVPRVCQSMSRSSCVLGGVMNSAAIAAAADTVSMSSFLRNPVIVFISFSLVPKIALPRADTKG